MTASHPLVAVYADESCLGNGKAGATPGGFGALVEFRGDTGALHRFDLWGSEADTTNNRMALRSVIDSFRALSRKGNRLSVQFTTDSRYIVDGMTQWVRGWMARGWRRKEGPVENVALWQEAVATIEGHEVAWRWVRGHAGHPQNEYANHLATSAASRQDASAGLAPSGFERWWAEQPAAARAVACDPFPETSAFRPAAPLPGPPAGRRDG